MNVYLMPAKDLKPGDYVKCKEGEFPVFYRIASIQDNFHPAYSSYDEAEWRIINFEGGRGNLYHTTDRVMVWDAQTA